MTWTYDPSTLRGQVRMLCTDIRESRPLISDEQIDFYLSLSGGDLLLAGADACDFIAKDLALVFKVTSLGGTRVDAIGAAAEFRAHAADLRKKANSGVVYPVNGAARGGLI